MRCTAAAVEEATTFKRYVLAHAYTPEAITRAVSQGVRTIEHGNLIDRGPENSPVEERPPH